MFADDFWTVVLEPYARDPVRAFILAQTFAVLRETLNEGPAGAIQVMGAMDLGIKELYQYSDVHEACFALYQRLISKEGLEPSFDPREIVQNLNRPRCSTRKAKRR